MEIRADVTDAGPVYIWDWDWLSELNGDWDEYEYSSTATVSSEIAGIYDANAWGKNYCEWDYDWARIYVVEVDGVYEGEWGSYNEGPVYVCPGDTVHLWAEPYPGNYSNWPDDEPTWDFAEPQPPGANAIITVDPYWDDEVDISGLTVPGNYVIEARCGDNDPGAEITITVVKVEMINPSGDPAKSSEAEEGVNEFTFDDSSNGYCYIKCESELTPDNAQTQAWAEDKVEWSISPSISGSQMKWGDYGGSTFTEADNKGKIVWIEFKGLPTDNGEFGLKTVQMSACGIQQTNDIEIFYSKSATNNPDGNSPNWFYYWNAVIGDPDAIYKSGTGIAGLCPAMGDWKPTMTYSKTEIWISDPASGGLGGKTGIDYFSDIVKHENVHVTQVSQADALLGSLNGLVGSIWEKGWSFHYSPNNHWTLGTDEKAGVAGLDDDGDDTIDEVSDNSEVGYPGSDDVDLNADDDNIPDAYENANPEWIEPAADAAMDTEENENSSSDWGSPGKQHGTNDKYDD